MNFDPRVDAYIEKAADFAKPILTHFRELVHAAEPEITETLKWGMPHFVMKGNICQMAGFKEHCAIGFRFDEVMEETLGISKDQNRGEAMGHFGRITSLKDLPSDAKLKKCIRKTVELDLAGKKVTKPKKAQKPVVVPEELRKALARHRGAGRIFEGMSPSMQREYCDWIADAKRDETRDKRIAQTIEWVSEGKSRNWKYENC